MNIRNVMDLSARMLFAPEGVAEAAIEHAAEVASDAVERAEELAEDALEAAEEKIEAAEELAEDIALAAMQTELGKRVADAIERVEQCRNELNASLESLATRVNAMEMALEEIQQMVAQPPTVAVVTTEAEPSSILSPEPATMETTAVVIDPGTPTPQIAPGENIPAVPARRRTRLI